jgi:hypothetical protein
LDREDIWRQFVDIDSKQVIIGTKKEQVDVPTVGVRDKKEE